MAKQRRFIQCDVFTATPTKGNALAVIVDAEGMSEESLWSFAKWTNLAETTFLFPPDNPEADYRVRILTPHREMPFAGHPTLGSCAAWLHTGGKPKEAGVVRQECGVGIVEIDIGASPPAFIAPPTKIKTMPAKVYAEITTALNINPDHVLRYAVLDNGPVWHAFELQTAEQVLSIDSSLTTTLGSRPIGFMGKHADSAECDFEVRMLHSLSNNYEDPITGSLNAALAHWRLHNKELHKPVLVAQGTCIDCEGRVFVTPNMSVDGEVRIGGESHIVVDGHVTL